MWAGRQHEQSPEYPPRKQKTPATNYIVTHIQHTYDYTIPLLLLFYFIPGNLKNSSYDYNSSRHLANTFKVILKNLVRRHRRHTIAYAIIFNYKSLNFSPLVYRFFFYFI